MLVPGNTTRPIMDRAKEALFSIIGPAVIDTLFLDLFGGTGAVGIEALSRGAHYVRFIELDRRAIRTIQENLRITGFTDQANVVRNNAFNVLKAKPDQPFDYIYIAPPQYKGMWRDALLALDENPLWVTEGVTVIVQIDPREDEPVTLEHLTEYDRRKYGQTLLIFYEGTYIPPENAD